MYQVIPKPLSGRLRQLRNGQASTNIEIRPATECDRAAVETLALLDAHRDDARYFCEQVSHHGVLVAVNPHGTLVAALALADDRTVADPFYPSASATTQLRNYAAKLARREGAVRRFQSIRSYPAALNGSRPASSLRLIHHDG